MSNANATTLLRTLEQVCENMKHISANKDLPSGVRYVALVTDNMAFTAADLLYEVYPGLSRVAMGNAR